MEQKESTFYDSVSELVTATIDNIVKVEQNGSECAGVTIPLPNQELLTLAAGDLVVLAGAAYSGKTSVAMNLAGLLSMQNNCPTGYFSTGPMEYIDLGKRFIAFESGISLAKMHSGKLSYDSLETIENAAKTLYEAPLYLNQTPNPFFAELECTARMMVEEQNVKVIIIDSLEYMQELVDSEQDQYRYALEALLKDLKDMAKNLAVSIVVLTELSDIGANQRASLKNFKRYMIIPRSADTVLILNRQPQNDGTVELNLSVPKNAHGRTFSVNYLRFI